MDADNRCKDIKKVGIGFLIIALAVTSYFTYKYYNVRQKQNFYYKIFLNQFYSSIDNSLSIVNTLLGDELNENEINKKLKSLTDSLNKTDHLLTDNAFYIDGVTHKGITFFNLTAQVISFGMEIDDTKIEPFDKDLALDGKEKAYLHELKNVLQEFRSTLYSDKSGQENPGFSKYAFNQLILYTGDHYLLLDKYVQYK